MAAGTEGRPQPTKDKRARRGCALTSTKKRAHAPQQELGKFQENTEGSQVADCSGQRSRHRLAKKPEPERGGGDKGREKWGAERAPAPAELSPGQGREPRAPFPQRDVQCPPEWPYDFRRSAHSCPRLGGPGSAVRGPAGKAGHVRILSARRAGVPSQFLGGLPRTPSISPGRLQALDSGNLAAEDRAPQRRLRSFCS